MDNYSSGFSGWFNRRLDDKNKNLCTRWKRKNFRPRALRNTDKMKFTPPPPLPSHLPCTNQLKTKLLRKEELKMETRFNVFAKELTNKETNRKFIVYFTKTQSGNYYDIRFVDGCDDDVDVPTGKKPFVLVVDNNRISVKVKDVEGNNGETYTKRIIYVRYIKAIEEFIEEPVDIDAL